MWLAWKSAKENFMYLYIQICVQPILLQQAWIPIFLSCKLMNLLIYPLFNLFLSQIPLMRHHTSLKHILVPTMEPFIGLRGPNLSSKVFVPTNKTLHYWPFRKKLALGCSLTRSSMGDDGTKFLHPKINVMSFSALDLPLRRSIIPQDSILQLY